MTLVWIFQELSLSAQFENGKNFALGRHEPGITPNAVEP